MLQTSHRLYLHNIGWPRQAARACVVKRRHQTENRNKRASQHCGCGNTAEPMKSSQRPKRACKGHFLRVYSQRRLHGARRHGQLGTIYMQAVTLDVLCYDFDRVSCFADSLVRTHASAEASAACPPVAAPEERRHAHLPGADHVEGHAHGQAALEVVEHKERQRQGTEALDGQAVRARRRHNVLQQVRQAALYRKPARHHKLGQRASVHEAHGAADRCPSYHCGLNVRVGREHAGCGLRGACVAGGRGWAVKWQSVPRAYSGQHWHTHGRQRTCSLDCVPVRTPRRAARDSAIIVASAACRAAGANHVCTRRAIAILPRFRGAIAAAAGMALTMVAAWPMACAAADAAPAAALHTAVPSSSHTDAITASWLLRATTAAEMKQAAMPLDGSRLAAACTRTGGTHTADDPATEGVPEEGAGDAVGCVASLRARPPTRACGIMRGASLASGLARRSPAVPEADGHDERPMQRTMPAICMQLIAPLVR